MVIQFCYGRINTCFVFDICCPKNCDIIHRHIFCDAAVEIRARSDRIIRPFGMFNHNVKSV